jgi:hypothetical protein
MLKLKSRFFLLLKLVKTTRTQNHKLVLLLSLSLSLFLSLSYCFYTIAVFSLSLPSFPLWQRRNTKHCLFTKKKSRNYFFFFCNDVILIFLSISLLTSHFCYQNKMRRLANKSIPKNATKNIFFLQTKCYNLYKIVFVSLFICRFYLFLCLCLVFFLSVCFSIFLWYLSVRLSVCFYSIPT